MPKQATVEFSNEVGIGNVNFYWTVYSPRGRPIACGINGSRTLHQCRKSYTKFAELMKLGCKEIIKP